MTPKLPPILIYRDSIDIIDGSYPLDKTNLLGLLRHSADEYLYFDNEGMIWSSTITSAKHKPTFINRLLAKTFYNPSITVKRNWKQVRRYELHELKHSINGCIDKDDDLLTQFVEGDILKQKIINCNDSRSIVTTLLKYVFQPDEDQINEELSIEEQ